MILRSRFLFLALVAATARAQIRPYERAVTDDGSALVWQEGSTTKYARIGGQEVRRSFAGLSTRLYRLPGGEFSKKITYGDLSPDGRWLFAIDRNKASQSKLVFIEAGAEQPLSIEDSIAVDGEAIGPKRLVQTGDLSY